MCERIVAMPRLPVPKPNGMFRATKMSEFPVEENGDCLGVKSDLVQKLSQQDVLQAKQQKMQASQTQHNTASSTQQIVANSSSSSSTTTTSRVAKTSSSSSSARVHHVSTELKASSMKSDLSELKSSISEMKNLSSMGFGMKNEEAVESGPVGSPEPLVTFPPDGETPPPLCSPPLCSPPLCSPPLCSPPICPPPLCSPQSQAESLKFESTRVSSQTKTKQWAENFSSEQAMAEQAESKRLQTADLLYQENLAASQRRARIDMDGVTAEKSLNKIQEQRSLKSGEMRQQESQNLSAATMRLQTESYSAEKKAMAAQQQRQTISSSGAMLNQEKHVTQSNITYTKKSSIVQSTSQMSQLVNNGQMVAMSMNEDEFLEQKFDDLQNFSAESTPQEVDRVIHKYANYMSGAMDAVKRSGGGVRAAGLLDKVNEMVRTAWSVPRHGHALGSSLCNVLRSSGSLDLLLSQCTADDQCLQFSSARLLEQCLTTENRDHVVEHGLERVVTSACSCTKNPNSVDHSRVGTGILEHLFKHSEGTCSDVIRLGGLDAVLFECRKNDVETLRHCAGALANLSLYGGADNQEAMIKRKVPMWLFPLAFHNDDNIKYYACLAIAVLVANSEIEAAVLKSGTLDLVEPFVTSHNPSEFAKSNLAHAHGQSKHWLQRLVPVLSSKREEARNLAAFHFCMEAGIKKQQGNTEIFREIGAIDPLKKVASSPNAVASKYAAQALRLIGEQVPHKLSQQVPLWNVEDVKEWVKQIGFLEYTTGFEDSRVDGDLLLQLTEDNLSNDLGITNGIRRKRFLRELQNLKKMADYSSRDVSNLNAFLLNIGPEFSIFTYSMLNAGVDKDLLRMLTEDHLVNECGITNSIQRQKILDSIKAIENSLGSSSEENLDKNLDVFVSYRRSNGSQLASLLKVHLQLRGFSVFIDVERLEAGKFDNNLLQSIRQARNFLLVLTPDALERCISDGECKDWVHREIVAALQSQCNIIPITDNFQWPNAEELPEDMRAVCHFNGIRWIHDYQDACVDKLERFLRGEVNNSVGRGDGVGRVRDATTPGTPSRPHNYQRLHSNLSSQDGSDKD